MTVSVESPMTEQSHVSDVLIVADGNPRGGVATFHFSPASGVAEANVRIRLAETQNVIAVAKMNDGSFFKASKPVKVTIGGCGGMSTQPVNTRPKERLQMAEVKPRIKLDKKQAKKGDLVEVKALVSHIMETGQRKDASGNIDPAQDPEQVHLHGERQGGLLGRFRAGGLRQSVYPVQVSAPRNPARSCSPGSMTTATKIVGEESITVT